MKPMPTFMIIALLFITLFIFLCKRSDPPASCFALARGLCTETPCVFGADIVASILPSLNPFVVKSTYIYCDSSPKAHYSANVRDDNNIDVKLFSPAQREVAVPRTVAIELPFDPPGVKPALYQRLKVGSNKLNTEVKSTQINIDSNSISSTQQRNDNSTISIQLDSSEVASASNQRSAVSKLLQPLQTFLISGFIIDFVLFCIWYIFCNFIRFSFYQLWMACNVFVFHLLCK